MSQTQQKISFVPCVYFFCFPPGCSLFDDDPQKEYKNTLTAIYIYIYSGTYIYDIYVIDIVFMLNNIYMFFVYVCTQQAQNRKICGTQHK